MEKEKPLEQMIKKTDESSPEMTQKLNKILADQAKMREERDQKTKELEAKRSENDKKLNTMVSALENADNEKIKTTLDALDTLTQAQVLYGIWNEIKLGEQKSPVFGQNYCERYEFYFLFTAKKINELSLLTELSKEQESLFRSILLLLNDSCAGINFAFMPLVTIRANELFPDYPLYTSGAKDFGKAKKMYRERYGADVLSDQMQQFTKEHPWKPSQITIVKPEYGSKHDEIPSDVIEKTKPTLDYFTKMREEREKRIKDLRAENKQSNREIIDAIKKNVAETNKNISDSLNKLDIVTQTQVLNSVWKEIEAGLEKSPHFLENHPGKYESYNNFASEKRNEFAQKQWNGDSKLTKEEEDLLKAAEKATEWWRG